MAWSLWACDTVSGDRIQRLPLPISFSWERILNGGGGGSMVIPLRDSVWSQLNVKALTRPISVTLVLEWDGFVVYAGVVNSRVYDFAAGTLTVSHEDIWTIFGRRLAIDHRVPVAKVVHQTFTSRSSATVASKMVQLSLEGLAGMNTSLPITFPSDASGSVTRKYYGYHFEWLGDVLQDLMDEDGGTDIDFRPRWVSNKLDWQMRTGALSSGSFEWHVGSDKSGLSKLSVTEDATKLGTSSYALGEGTEVDKLARSTRDLTPDYPFVDRLTTLSSVDSEDALTRWATGDLATHKKPTEQWAMSVLASGDPGVADLLLGGSAKVWVENDPWLSRGWKQNRLVGFSGDLSEKVSLQLQPGGG